MTLSRTWNVYILGSICFKLLAVADFLSALLHASTPAFGKKEKKKKKNQVVQQVSLRVG